MPYGYINNYEFTANIARICIPEADLNMYSKDINLQSKLPVIITNPIQEIKIYF